MFRSYLACAFLTAGALFAAACSQDAPTATTAAESDIDANRVPEVNPAPLGGSLFPLNADDRSQFLRGSIVFNTVFTPATGLGPLFNARSCAACHNRPVVGGSGTPI